MTFFINEWQSGVCGTRRKRDNTASVPAGGRKEKANEKESDARQTRDRRAPRGRNGATRRGGGGRAGTRGVKGQEAGREGKGRGRCGVLAGQAAFPCACALSFALCALHMSAIGTRVHTLCGPPRTCPRLCVKALTHNKSWSVGTPGSS